MTNLTYSLLRLLFTWVISVQANSTPHTTVTDNDLQKLQQHQWQHGAANCLIQQATAIESYQYNAQTFVLRQNKCLHYEAPFIYLLIGKERALLLDTGATANANEFPLYDEVQKLVSSVSSSNHSMPLLVLHSHGHSDHVAADGQFQNRPGTTLIPPNLSGVKAHFGYGPKGLNWPDDTKLIDLGGRKLTLIPIPGHSEDAIALFDEQTGWLLTGDSLYPGRLYVRNWQQYRLSIQRLYEYTASLAVTAIMGTHVEMSKTPGVDYPMGATYQPNEAPLPLDFEQLKILQDLLQITPSPTRRVGDTFILQPLD